MGKNKMLKRLLNLAIIPALTLGLWAGGAGSLPTAGASSYNLTEDGVAEPESTFLLSPDKEARAGLGYYMDDVVPGETREYKFYVKNLLNETRTFIIYPTDAKPAQNGGIAFQGSEEGITEGGNWVYPQGAKKIQLKGQEMREYTYQVKIPKDIEPGQHVAVLAVSQFQEAQVSQKAANSNSATLAPDIKEELGIWIVMNYKVDQAEHAMSINTFKHNYISSGESQLVITLENTGTILEKPTGYIEVRNSKKEVMYRNDYQAGSIYHGKVANMVSELTNTLLLPDEYEVYFEANFAGKKEWKIFKFTVTPEASKNAQETLEYYDRLEVNNGIPDWLKYVIIGGSILILVLLILLLLLFLRRRKQDIEERIIFYVEKKKLQFGKARKKVGCDEKTFIMYAEKLKYIQEGEELDWEKTLEMLRAYQARQTPIVREATPDEDFDVEISVEEEVAVSKEGGTDEEKK